MSILRSKLIMLLAIVTALTCQPLYAAEYNTDEDGLLVHGYDLVSFFDGEPVKGRAAIEVKGDGFRLRFASDENMQRYLDDPEAFQPAFGGYCAYGVRMGKKFDIDPAAYAIQDGTLYMLLNRSTRTIWENDQSRNIGLAQRLWPNISMIPSGELNET